MKTVSKVMQAVTMGATVLLLGAGSAQALDSSWTNIASGTFGNSGNWDNGVPGLSTNVWFGNGQTFTVTMDGNYSTRGVIVTNGTVVTIDLNDGTARTWEAAGPTDTRDPKIEVRGSTLIVTDNGTIDANNSPTYQNWPGLLLSGGSTAVIRNGAYVDVGYVGKVGLGATDKLIVTDPGTILVSDGVSPAAGCSVLVTNGGVFNGSDWYNPGDLTVTGPGSKGTFNAYVYNASSVTITDGGRIDSTLEIFSPNVIIGGGSGVSTAQLSTSYIGDWYNSYSWKVTTNGVVDIIGGFLEVRDGYDSQAQSSILTMDAGTISMRTNSELRVMNNNTYNVNGNAGVLRGTGTIKRGAAGVNFSLRNEGFIQPGDVSSTQALGTLILSGGNLYQTNPAVATAGMYFQFSDTGLDQIDISNGLAQITVGTNLFSLASGASEPHRGAQYGLVKYDFIIATNITYSPQYDNLTNLLVGTYGLTYGVHFTYGVVNLGGGLQALELEFLPPPGTQILIQ